MGEIEQNDLAPSDSVSTDFHIHKIRVSQIIFSCAYSFRSDIAYCYMLCELFLVYMSLTIILVSDVVQM